MLSLTRETLLCQTLWNYWSGRRNGHRNRRWEGRRRRKVESTGAGAWRSWRLSGGCRGAVRTDSMRFLSTRSAVSVPWRMLVPQGILGRSASIHIMHSLPLHIPPSIERTAQKSWFRRVWPSRLLFDTVHSSSSQGGSDWVCGIFGQMKFQAAKMQHSAHSRVWGLKPSMSWKMLTPGIRPGVCFTCWALPDTVTLEIMNSPSRCSPALLTIPDLSEHRCGWKCLWPQTWEGSPVPTLGHCSCKLCGQPSRGRPVFLLIREPGQRSGLETHVPRWAK